MFWHGVSGYLCNVMYCCVYRFISFCSFAVLQCSVSSKWPSQKQTRSGRLDRMPKQHARRTATLSAPLWDLRRKNLPSGELTFCNGKSPFLMGKSVNPLFLWPFPIAMLVHQRVSSHDSAHDGLACLRDTFLSTCPPKKARSICSFVHSIPFRIWNAAPM